MKEALAEYLGETEPAPTEHCGEPLIVEQKIFYWRSKFFSGLRCQKCSAAWNNPNDSFADYVIKRTL